ncbi:MAG: hypothetical protein MJB12_18880 [Firmicutes bacterium]|nr:hypothetical protein [Bacillota bacterium]
MKCSEANEWMMKYFDGEINDLNLYRLKQHMKSCSVCSMQHRTMSEIIECMGEQPLLEPPEDFEDCVMNAVHKDAAFRKHFLKTPLKVMLALLGSALLIMTVWTLLILQSVPLLELIGTMIRNGLSVNLFNSILEVFQNGYKTVVIIGDSILNVYYILLKNYYDVMFSMVALLIIVYMMAVRKTKTVR